MRRISLFLVIISAALVAAGCGEYGQRYTGSEQAASTTGEEKRITDAKFDDAARKRDGCTEIKELESNGRNHTEDKVTYEENPPVTGDHNPVAAEWGLYDKSQKDTATTHNLEHGHIVISFKGLTDAQKAKLYEHARVNPFHLLVQPREKNPKDGIFYTAWGAQLFCKTPSAAGLQHMIDNWRDQGPELFTDDPGGSMGLEGKDN